MNDEKLEIIDVNEEETNTPNVVVNPTVEPVPIEKVEPVETNTNTTLDNVENANTVSVEKTQNETQ